MNHNINVVIHNPAFFYCQVRFFDKMLIFIFSFSQAALSLASLSKSSWCSSSSGGNTFIELSLQLYTFMKEDHHRSQITDHLHINSRCPGKVKKRGVLKENIQRLLERENRNLFGIFRVSRKITQKLNMLNKFLFLIFVTDAANLKCLLIIFTMQ